MTALLNHRSEKAGVCACCLRIASNLQVGSSRAWTCSTPTCVAISTGALNDMPEQQLSALEKRACERGAAEIAEGVVGDVMGAVWDAGVRDLASATPAQIEKAMAAVRGTLAAHVEAALAAYAASVSADLKDGACPF